MESTINAKVEAVALAKERLAQANKRVDAAQEEKTIAMQEQRNAWDALYEAQRALLETI